VAGQRRLHAFIDHLQLTAQRIVVAIVVAGLAHRAQRAFVEGADGGIVHFLARIFRRRGGDGKLLFFGGGGFPSG
jgi:hypothetical protein